MGNQKILFVSGSLGLGHVTRDISMVRELRARRKDLDVVWLADPPVVSYLRERGERVLPDLERLGEGPNDLCDARASDYCMNLYPWWLEYYKIFPERVKAINAAADREEVDLIVGDEAYDLYCEYQKHPKLRKRPFLLMLDFLGGHARDGIEKGRNPLPLWFFNKWSYDHIKMYHGKEGTIFIGEAEDVVDESLGLMLPNRRDAVKKYTDCVGYSLPFDPAKIEGKDDMRERLGYGPEPLILVTIGGTAAGAPLLRRASEAYPLIKKSVPGARMLLVAGPRVPTDYVKAQGGLEVRGHVPDLYQHMAASDLVISAGGGTTTTELQALNRPFIYFPLEKHFEQQVDVAYHLERDKVGRKMSYAKSDAQQLASAALEDMGKKVSYPKLRIEGAKLSAEHIISVLDRIGKGEIKASG